MRSRKAGAATVSSDEIVHHLLRDEPEVREAIVQELGEGVLGDDGSIDRGRVAEVVFADRAKLDFLEALLHPKVAAEYLTWREQLAGAAATRPASPSPRCRSSTRPAATSASTRSS